MVTLSHLIGTHGSIIKIVINGEIIVTKMSESKLAEQGTLSSWIVKCNSCGAERSLKGVTQNSSKKCREISPWIEWEYGQNCVEKFINRRRNSSSISHQLVVV